MKRSETRESLLRIRIDYDTILGTTANNFEASRVERCALHGVVEGCEERKNSLSPRLRRGTYTTAPLGVLAFS